MNSTSATKENAIAPPADRAFVQMTAPPMAKKISRPTLGTARRRIAGIRSYLVECRRPGSCVLLDHDRSTRESVGQ
jgi:hypothetical protein